MAEGNESQTEENPVDWAPGELNFIALELAWRWKIWAHCIYGSVDRVSLNYTYAILPKEEEYSKGEYSAILSQGSINIFSPLLFQRVTLKVCEQKMNYVWDHRYTKVALCFLHTNLFLCCQQTRCWNFHNSHFHLCCQVRYLACICFYQKLPLVSWSKLQYSGVFKWYFFILVPQHGSKSLTI